MTPYANFQSRQVKLGGGSNDLSVDGTFSGATALRAGNSGGTDTIHVLGIGGATSVTTAGDAFTALVNNIHNRLDTIKGSLDVNGAGATTARLVVNATGVAAGNATVADGTVSGLGLTTALTYKGLSQLEVDLGIGAASATLNLIQPGAAAYLVNGGPGNDTFTVNADGTSISASVTLNGGAGNDTFTIEASKTTALHLAANGGAGNDVIGLTTTATAAVIGTIEGGTGNDTANITLAAPGLNSLTTSNVEQVNFTSPSSAATTWLLDQNKLSAGAQTVLTTLNAAVSNLTLTGPTGLTTVLAIDHATNLSTTGPVTVGGVRGITGVALDAVGATLQLTGTGALTLDDTHFQGTARASQLGAGVAAGFNPAGQVQYHGFASLTVNLSAAADTVAVDDTSVPTTLNSGDGADNVTVNHLSNATTVNLGDKLDQLTVHAATAP